MSAPQFNRRLLAILAADVVGYSRLMDVDEPGTIVRLRAARADVLDPLIARHRGHLVKLMGDGALVTFDSVVDAVTCAIEVQQLMAARNAALPEAERITLRIGVNLGDVALVDNDVYGEGVNVAARLEQLCEPGGVLVSGTAFDQLQGKLGLPLDFAGEHQVKNIARPVRTYRAQLDGTQKPRRRSLKRGSLRVQGLAAAAIIAAGIIAALAWWINARSPVVATPSVAVLPFEDLSGDPANGRLADGITEDIIIDLSRYREFKVIARNSTAVYKGKPTDVRQIGKDLNVQYVLEGSFQRQGNEIRITTKLIDVATATPVWSERFDRPADKLFAIQSEVADRIANSLGGATGQLPADILAAAKRKRPGDLGAYELFLLGRDKAAGLTLENQLEAKRLLEQAIQIDPTLARAHAMLAWTYSWRISLEADTAKLTQEMLSAARRAVELDPMDADAHQSLGYAIGLTGDLRQAESEFDKALQLNPNGFDTLTVYACWAHSFGKAEDGAKAVLRAIQLNPNYPPWAVDCFRTALVMVGKYEDVLRNQARQPENTWNQDAYVFSAASLAALGRNDEAKALVARGMAKYPGLLSIEKFALNRGWAPVTVPIVTDLMRKAGFPVCAADSELEGTANPARLPECVN